MRIATFNLENLDDQPGLDPPLAERLDILRPQILRLEADVLCLQEVNAQSSERHAPRRLLALERLLEGTPYAGFEQASSLSPSGQGPADKHNLVVLSRWPLAAVRQIRHELVAPATYRSATAEPTATDAEPILWDRPVLQVEIELPQGARLHLFNLHLRAPLAAPVAGQKLESFRWRTVGGWAEGFYLAALKRAGQALETRLAIEGVFDRDPRALIAVCGDFNAEDREVPLRIIQGDVEDTGNGALAARTLVPLERTLPESQRFSVLHHGHRLMLDHMLVSRALMAAYRHVEVHNEALGDELVAYATDSRSPESFHAPIVAEFDISAL